MEKYQLLVKNITDRRWNVEPLIVITTGAKITKHSFNENY